MASSEAKAPKAIIHQRILQQAEADPDASMSKIAAEVSGASVDLVERVLDEYGDPAEPSEKPVADHIEPTNGHSASPPDGDFPSAEPTTVPDWNSLSEKIRETLREVHRHPEATQQDIADRLDVSAPTVSNRLSELEGFDWTEREGFVDKLPEDELQPTDGDAHNHDMTDLEPPEPDEATNTPMTSADQSPSSDSELVHKVIRVCMDSDEFSEAEEVQLISWFV